MFVGVSDFKILDLNFFGNTPETVDLLTPTLSKILPSPEQSNSIFNEFIMPVDCENPKDIKF